MPTKTNDSIVLHKVVPVVSVWDITRNPKKAYLFDLVMLSNEGIGSQT